MSSYRDDIQETAIASNSTFARMKMLVVELAKATSHLLVAIAVLHSDVVIASDQVTESRYQVVYESAKISDAILGGSTSVQRIDESAKIADRDLSHMKSRALIEDSALASDQISESSRATLTDFARITDKIIDKNRSSGVANELFKVKDNVLDRALKKTQIEDRLSINDSVIDGLSSLITDTAAIADLVIDKRSSKSFSTEQAKINDTVYRVAREQWQDDLVPGDPFTGKLKASILLHESGIISDALLQEQKIKEVLIDSIFIKELVSDHLLAKNTIDDAVFADDQIIDSYDKSGFAWTANVDNWAMSRYQSYQFDDLSVIDGVLYGVNSNGVYRLDANNHVDGQVITGKVDLGQGQLVHPLGAYLEYELSGIAGKLEVAVSTTQNGAKQTYLYKLPSEQASQLTNGRVLFGRGLRGRHFAFEINMSGEHGYINDLSVDIAATKRRV